MALLSNILGLDLGSHSLKAVELRQTLRGFEPASMHILAREGDAIPLAESISQLVRSHRLATQHVVCAIPGDRLSTRRLSFPFRDRKKLSQAVPYEVEASSLFDLDDVIIDWELVGGDRDRAEVVATIAARTEVSTLLETLREAHAEARTIEAEGLVLANLSSVFELGGTRMLIDFGHRKTTCCLIADGQPVAARTFPIAGAAITEALAHDRGLSTADAERAKCLEGATGAGGGATPATRAVLDRIVREIVRTLGALEPQIAALATGPLAELTLLGGSAQLRGFDELLRSQTGYRVSRLGPPLDDVGRSLTANTDPTVFAPAIALALRGTAQARTRMDFRQQEFAVRIDLGRYRRELTWPLRLAAATVILGLVSIGTATALERHRAGALEQRIEQLFAEAFPGRALPDNPISALREEIATASARAEFLGVYRGNLSALDLLTEISRFVPKSLDVVFDELSIDRQIIRMRVRAKSFEAADRLGAELAKFPPFAQARIGSIDSDPSSGDKRFDVTISLAPAEAAP
ncbi:MAG TPA: type II secretion system protein GspL [Myxococcota bacterium]|nr:type II secretion system protein GspL [Myxococcota bacterium]